MSFLSASVENSGNKYTIRSKTFCPKETSAFQFLRSGRGSVSIQPGPQRCSSSTAHKHCLGSAPKDPGLQKGSQCSTEENRPGQGASRQVLAGPLTAKGTRTQARGGDHTGYLDEVALEQGGVHAAGDLPGQLQGAVPVADPPTSPQAKAAPGGRGVRTAQREQQEQVGAHAGTRRKVSALALRETTEAKRALREPGRQPSQPRPRPRPPAPPAGQLSGRDARSGRG